ncbi:MAG TPA: carbon storage regulator [Bacteroidota bacterium]|nr:carbon storage regulator [Bacteroidota bacterium]
MLVLARKPSEAIKIGDQIIVKVIAIRGGQVKLGIEAPAGVRVIRTDSHPPTGALNHRAGNSPGGSHPGDRAVSEGNSHGTPFSNGGPEHPAAGEHLAAGKDAAAGEHSAAAERSAAGEAPTVGEHQAADEHSAAEEQPHPLHPPDANEGNGSESGSSEVQR